MRKIDAMKNLAIALAVAMAVPAAAQAENETNVLFYESFNGLAGMGGNDGYFDNDATAGVEVGVEDLLTAETLDNKDGWGNFVKVAICNQCVRLATKKNSGEITTPAVAVDGAATLTFNAAAQLGDVVTLYVEVVGEGKLTYGEQTDQKIAIALPETVAGETSLPAQTYSVAITEATGNVSLKFSTVSSADSKQRAYLDEIKVVSNASTALSHISSPKADSEVYDLLGRRVKDVGRGLFIINGKKVIR
ncbi:MAG: hypothetical protein ACI36X_04640 [Bacteroidaceae bacterium]